MAELSLKLVIKNANTSNIADLENLQQIVITNQNIVKIDNLEMFYTIKHLNLSRNRIRVIENIDFLINLDFFDISHNAITSESLLASLNRRCIPPCLKAVNLSGNPCSTDEDVLVALQDRFPNLQIIIGEEIYDGDDINGRENTVPNNNREEEDNDDDVDDLEEHTMPTDAVLNAESVLKQIVDRKCSLQNYSSYDTSKIVAELSGESECFRDRRRLRSQFVTTDGSYSEVVGREAGDDGMRSAFGKYSVAREGLNKMLVAVREDGVRSGEYMVRLKATSEHFRSQMFEKSK